MACTTLVATPHPSLPLKGGGIEADDNGDAESLRGGAVVGRARPLDFLVAYCARDMVSKLNICSVIGL